MDQSSVMRKLNFLMGLANISSVVHHSGHPRGFDGPEVLLADWPTNMTSSMLNMTFNFSADTAAGLIEDYLANMFTVSQPTTIALLCLYAPVFLFSLAGNSFVIVMFVKDRRMRRVKSLFLVNLALNWTHIPRLMSVAGLAWRNSDVFAAFLRLSSFTRCTLRLRYLRILCDVDLVNLALADEAVTVVCIPLVIGQTLFRLWIYGDILCKLTGFMQGRPSYFIFNQKPAHSNNKS